MLWSWNKIRDTVSFWQGTEMLDCPVKCRTVSIYRIKIETMHMLVLSLFSSNSTQICYLHTFGWHLSVPVFSNSLPFGLIHTGVLIHTTTQSIEVTGVQLIDLEQANAYQVDPWLNPVGKVKHVRGVAWTESRLRLLPLFTWGFYVMCNSWNFSFFLVDFYKAEISSFQWLPAYKDLLEPEAASFISLYQVDRQIWFAHVCSRKVAHQVVKAG